MEVELKYRMTDVVDGRTAAGGRRPRRASRATMPSRDRPYTTTAIVDTDDGRWRPPATRAACGTHGVGHRSSRLKGLARHDDGAALQRREELEGPGGPGAAAARTGPRPRPATP